MNEIICGDCLEQQLPTADLFLTDPPYGISRASGFKQGGNQDKFGGYTTDYGEWDKKAACPAVLATLAERSLREGGTAIIFFDWRKLGSLAGCLEESGFSKVRMIVWTKTNPVPVNTRSTYLSNAREVAVSAIKGKGKANAFHSHYDKGDYIYPLRDCGKNVHPTQKPLGLMEQLVLKHSNPGDLVLDPYCGSGTTCLAAKRSQRNYLGIDINQEYCELARARILEDVC